MTSGVASGKVLPSAVLMNRVNGLVLLRFLTFSFDAPPFVSVMTSGRRFSNCSTCCFFLHSSPPVLSAGNYLGEVSFKWAFLLWLFANSLCNGLSWICKILTMFTAGSGIASAFHAFSVAIHALLRKKVRHHLSFLFLCLCQRSLEEGCPFPGKHFLFGFRTIIPLGLYTKPLK